MALVRRSLAATAVDNFQDNTHTHTVKLDRKMKKGKGASDAGRKKKYDTVETKWVGQDIAITGRQVGEKQK